MLSDRARFIITYLCLLLGLVLATMEWATAQTAPIPVKAPAVVVSGCPPTQMSLCNGFYAGVNIGTAGMQSDISNAGVPASVFTAGGIAGVNIGWQYWSTTNGLPWYAGIEVMADYDAMGTVGGSPGALVVEKFQAGGLFQNLLTGGTAPGQGPLAIGPFTALIPFIEGGPAQRQFGGSGFANGWMGGTGVAIPLGGRWTAKVEYMHLGWTNKVNPAIKVNAEDVVNIGLNYHF